MSTKDLDSIAIGMAGRYRGSTKVVETHAGRLILHYSQDDNPSVRAITQSAQGELSTVGCVSFTIEDGGLAPWRMTVRENARRMGICAAMFDFAREYSGQEIVKPDPKINPFTPAGQAFWDSYHSPAPATPKNKYWPHTDMIRASDGSPQLLYHGTKIDFDQFDPAKTVDGGFHFGTIEQARMRASGGEKILVGAYISAENLQRSKDTGGNWQAKIKAAKSAGKDGIVYLNRYEGLSASVVNELSSKGLLDKLDSMSDAQFRRAVPTATDSYIVFDPTRILIVSKEKEGPKPGPANRKATPPLIDLSPDLVGRIQECTIGATTISFRYDGKELDIGSVRTPHAKRGKGSARHAMEKFLKCADALGLASRLVSSPLDKKTNPTRLARFYRSIGYGPTGRQANPAGDPELYRLPRPHLSLNCQRLKDMDMDNAPTKARHQPTPGLS